MPNLPTYTVADQATYDRIVASFPGATSADKVAAYNDWLTNRLIERVSTVEGQRAMDAVAASLPPHRPEPAISF